MKITDGPLPGLRIIEPRVFADERGCFYETFQQERYTALGLPTFVQDNAAHSKRNVLRGLHYQLPCAQGKLVGVTRGNIWDVVVDLRRGSPTFKQWFGIHLDEQTHKQIYVPTGFAHGYCVLSDEADVYYKCTAFYSPTDEKGLAWNDPMLNIHWPVQNPILSEKDLYYPHLNALTEDRLFHYERG